MYKVKYKAGPVLHSRPNVCPPRLTGTYLAVHVVPNNNTAKASCDGQQCIIEIKATCMLLFCPHDAHKSITLFSV